MPTPLPNHLIHEKSPYLLQHAYNPVKWFAWTEQAFAKAKAENKPIFLSIGYSTCHWCHVMEHESFEDEDTAKLLNELFVPIKVDREERPDIDSIYMAFVTATTGRGGWPMSVFLTPEQKPFYGGTYFPPQPRWGSPGFKDILWSVHQSWIKQEDKVRSSSLSFVEALNEQIKTKIPSSQNFSAEILTKAYSQLEENFDTQNGGFGSSPKFPMGHNLSFLLRYGTHEKESEAQMMVEKTLSVMAQSGINDQLGGGFHRYSTDPYWQVPHFEKMLYDQALLAKVYLEAYLVTGKTSYAATARQTLDYVLKDMTDAKGGFYSAEDADSLEAGCDNPHEKKEGAFYLWRTDELTALLTTEELKILCTHYGLEPQGNAVVDPLGEFTGKNVLHTKRTAEDLALSFHLPAEEIQKTLTNIKAKLLAVRDTRVRPFRDDKILTDWNALMISAFTLAGQILNEPRYLETAQRAAVFILKNLQDQNGRLLHRYRDGEAAILSGLDDYAFCIAAFLDLYENTFQEVYLKQAQRLCDEMIRLFWDQEHGAFFLIAVDGEPLIYRPKEVYDGAVPSGNSVAALDLLRLYHFTFQEGYLQKAEAIFKFFYNDIVSHPGSHGQMMMAVQFFLGPVREITFNGDVTSVNGRVLLETVLKKWDPLRVLRIQPGSPGEKPSVSVCTNRVCLLPVETVEQLKNVLS